MGLRVDGMKKGVDSTGKVKWFTRFGTALWCTVEQPYSRI